MRSGCCVLLVVSACYAPRIVGGAPCNPNIGDSCPSGQTCEASNGGHFCSGGSSVDGGDPAPDAGTCVATGLVGPICLARAPSEVLQLTVPTTITTTSTNAGDCTEIRPQIGGPPLRGVAAG